MILHTIRLRSSPPPLADRAHATLFLPSHLHSNFSAQHTLLPPQPTPILHRTHLASPASLSSLTPYSLPPSSPSNSP
ncbi:hypothetical protein M758_UG314200 [Ceratodon purpureus]|nr:hypothetical protein M758_UG314200 [Ceratodon purpureus]